MRERRIEIVVRSHPGVLAHVVGLVARRGFDVERIEYARGEERGLGRVRLSVRDDGRVDRLALELGRLHDVVRVAEAGGTLFSGRASP
jgi:acetolactate synthase-1/3 small subunit